jgi:hypothetical protein
MVYTGDRLAVAAINGDISSAISALQKLFVGRQLGYSLNPEGIIEQQRLVKGTFFAFLARLTSAHPHMTSRYVDLIVFAKTYFPVQFAQFEAANPGLPADLEQLTASPHAGAVPSPERPEAAATPGRDWVWVGATAVVLLAIGAFGWDRATAYRAYEDDYTPSYSAPDTSSTPDSTSSTPDTSNTPDSSQSGTPDNSPSENDPATGLPLHVHRTDSGQLEPDSGCAWLNSDANDFRVTCNN